jgi:uncharacterized glyoxalase superfamily protein PhnB
MPHLLRIAPEFPVSDISASTDHYRRAFGFSIAATMPDSDYAIVQRDGVAIHIFTDGLDELHTELARRGAHITQQIVRKPWGARDFRVLDNCGNELKFTEPFADD